MSSDRPPRDPYAGEGLTPVGKKPEDLRSSLPDVPDGEDLNLRLAWALTNDDGNSDRLIAREGHDLFYIEGVGWVVWDGARWQRERGDKLAAERGFAAARAIRQEIQALDKAARTGAVNTDQAIERIKRLTRHAVTSGDVSKISAMLKAASWKLSRLEDDFDRDGFLVTAPNCTIELGVHCEARSVDRGDMITRSLGVRFNEKAQCPLFLKFLERILPDPEMRAFVQRVFGYCLTGSMREQVIFLFYGLGKNGKSTLLHVMRHVFGDYAMSTPVTTFLAKREGASGAEASPDLARLPGSRMVVAAEPAAGVRLDEGRVKEATGGERMTVRHLNQGFFEFVPAFKLVIPANHRPAIRGADEGIWRRIRIVPFLEQIPDSEVRRDLGAELLAEGEGVLNWLLDGVEDWAAHGLAPPAAAIAAVDRYRADQDPVGEFLDARIVRVPEAAGRITAKVMRAHYKEWCEEEGLDPLSGKAFGERLTQHKVERKKSHGTTVYVGVIYQKDSEIPDERGGGL